MNTSTKDELLSLLKVKLAAQEALCSARVQNVSSDHELALEQDLAYRRLFQVSLDADMAYDEAARRYIKAEGEAMTAPVMIGNFVTDEHTAQDTLSQAFLAFETAIIAAGALTSCRHNELEGLLEAFRDFRTDNQPNYADWEEAVQALKSEGF